ncbi:hypothetical protein N1851_002318 [Merluccius polli]|uniref:Uncharacterized protein n=1 Tax=Merluccius polli TaxID=89951 RepID=A0AA47P8T7_MERPO|nr:hypothetical protein N1851_002318 [Merluccius polli]
MEAPSEKPPLAQALRRIIEVQESQIQAHKRQTQAMMDLAVEPSGPDLPRSSLHFGPQGPSGNLDLQHALGQSAAECEAVGKSEAMVLCQKMVDCSLRLGSKLVPHAKEFKYLRVLFTSEGKM